MELLLAEVFIKAALLCGLLYLIARHEADYSFQKVAMVTAGLMLGSILLDALAKPHLGPWTALLQVAFIAFMIMTFCWITFWKSLVVVAVYVGVHFALAALAGKAVAYLDKESSKSAGMVVMGANEAEFRELQAAIGLEVPPLPVPVADPVHDDAEVEPEPEREPAVAATPPPTSDPATESDLPAAPEDEWATARRSLVVGGMASGSHAATTVFINGQLREAGDIIAANWNGYVYRWRVRDISQQGIRLQPLDKRPAPEAPAAVTD